MAARHQRYYLATKGTPAHTKRNQESSLRYNLKHAYGITLERYNEMLFEQGGTCAICFGGNANGQRLSVDHDHASGEVRALLCSPCNTSVGLLKEDPTRMRSAAAYIERHRNIQN